MEQKEKRRIGIVRGGAHKDYYASIREGGDIITHIFENLSDKWKVIDIFIDRDGVWHWGGIQIEPQDLSEKLDLAWNTTTPETGNILNNLAIPSINISSFSTLLRQNSDMLREHLRDIGLNMPRRIVLPAYQEDFDARPTARSFGRGPEEYAVRKAKEIWQKFGAPWTVKTFTDDANMGIHVAKTFPELVDAILDGVHHSKSILVEELIGGTNATVHSVAGFRNQEVYVFPPERISRDHKSVLEETVKKLHDHLGVAHYLRSDFVIHPKRGIYVTEISFSPDLKKESHFHQICESVGAKAHHVIEHILERAVI